MTDLVGLIFVKLLNWKGYDDMKKLICSIVSATMLMSVFGNVVSFANESETSISQLEPVGEIGVEFISVEKDIKKADSELLSASNLDELAEISRRRFEADSSNYSKEKMERIERVMSEYEEMTNNSNGVVVASESETQEEYIIGNRGLLAFFCVEDGMSVSDVYTASTIGENALEEAKSVYPNSSDAGGLRDSYRHFTWNHRMADSLSQVDARIVGCNYEWAGILENYAQNLYVDYIAEGLTETEASYKACLYAIYFRDECYSVCASSQSYFTSFFDNADIRDLWNNCYGRAYAVNYSYNHGTAFNVAVANNELINSDSAVTSSHIYSVWSWDWYTAI